MTMAETKILQRFKKYSLQSCRFINFS